jgi:membrane fusion protein, multidrug efflux system
MNAITGKIEADPTIHPHTFVEEQAPHANTKRKKLFIALAASVALLGGSYYGYDTLVGAKYAVTDNAYVGADVAQVTPLVGGPVAEVLVQDAQHVRKGDVLIRLDDTDAKLAVAAAEARLAIAQRQIRSLVATGSGLRAQVAARAADQMQASAQIAAARANLEKAQTDFRRRESLVASGSVSGEELTSARNALATAQANLAAAQATSAQAAAGRQAAVGTMNSNSALIAGTSVDGNPEVLAARAALEQARVDLARTVIRAPVDGIVSRRQVQVGQRVEPGKPLMAIVPIQSAYVDANFKEVQLAKVRPGQLVKLTSDLYGDKIVYHGRVVGFSGGTGAAFSVVPAQNATGNWIKVVQRVPVRIALEPKELAAHPLRVGLSMTAEIKLK